MPCESKWNWSESRPGRTNPSEIWISSRPHPPTFSSSTRMFIPSSLLFVHLCPNFPTVHVSVRPPAAHPRDLISPINCAVLIINLLKEKGWAQTWHHLLFLSFFLSTCYSFLHLVCAKGQFPAFWELMWNKGSGHDSLCIIMLEQ